MQLFPAVPTAAVILFAAHFGSSLDAGQPLCRDIDVTKSVPETKAFVDALDAASAPGRCYGTIMQATFRDHRLSRIMAVVDTAPPDLDTYADFRTARYEGMSYRPDLEHWAQQGSWEKALFAEIQRTRAVAQEALRIDYAKRVHLDPKRAAKLAEYHIEQLIESYTGDASRIRRRCTTPRAAWTGTTSTSTSPTASHRKSAAATVNTTTPRRPPSCAACWGLPS